MNELKRWFQKQYLSEFTIFFSITLIVLVARRIGRPSEFIMAFPKFVMLIVGTSLIFAMVMPFFTKVTGLFFKGLFVFIKQTVHKLKNQDKTNDQ